MQVKYSKMNRGKFVADIWKVFVLSLAPSQSFYFSSLLSNAPHNDEYKFIQFDSLYLVCKFVLCKIWWTSQKLQCYIR